MEKVPENWEDLVNEKNEEKNLKVVETVKEEAKLPIITPQIIQNNEEPNIPTKSKKYKTPVICILGGVDAGKTSLQDAIRHTNVVDKEAGRITQRIQGTNIQKKEIEYYFSKFKTKREFNITIPGILLLDTPGHESFISLRQLGSSLCNMAIIIVDIRKGPNKQTDESIQLLLESKVPFIIALNKIDTIYGWKTIDEAPFSLTIKNQGTHTTDQFNKLVMQNFVQFANSGVNAKLYSELPNFKDWVPMVPISAKTKEGFSDLIAVLVKMSEKFLGLVDNDSVTKGIVLEKYSDVQGVGESLDIIVLEGSLKVNDTIYIQGQPSKIKTITFYNHLTRKIETLKRADAAFACTISGTNLKDALPNHHFSSNQQQIQVEEIMTKEEIDKLVLSGNENNENKGIFIQADSVGSLLALAHVLKQNNVPIKKYMIGNIIRYKTVVYVSQFCEPSVILGFNVTLENGLSSAGTRIFTDSIVFKLVDKYNEFYEEYLENKRREALEKRNGAIFPCLLTIEKNCIFRQKSPLIFAVKVKKGILRIGTPLSTFKMDMVKTKAADTRAKNEQVGFASAKNEQLQSTFVTKEMKVEINLGKVVSIRDTTDKDIEVANKGQVVVIKVEGDDSITYGRHFTEDSVLYSRISRASLDCLKEHFKDEIDKDCLDLLVKLKGIFIIL